jgi:hypothetical protein
MDLFAIEQQLGLHNPARAKRWEHLIVDENGKKYPDVADPFNQYAVERLLDNTIAGAMESFKLRGMPATQLLKSVYESTTNTSPGVASFLKFAFPLVRRIWSKSIGRQLVSVQPMSLPTAMVFTLDHIRNTGTTQLENRDVTNPLAKDYAHDPGELQSGVRELNIKISSSSVTATSKKIKAVHSIEVGQDIFSYHGINISSELLGIMAQEIAREIDEQIIYDLINNASAGNANWNATPSSSLPTEIEAHRKTIKNSFIQASNLIFNNIYRDANFIVGGTAEVERLEMLGDHNYVKNPDQSVNQYGRVLSGRIFGQYDVYKDPWFPVNDQFLVGYKGQSWLESGYVFAPYIPYMLLPEFTNPDNFSITKAAMARQGYFMKNMDCYATVTIVGS